MASAKDTALHLLEQADVQLDGNRPWDLIVHNPRLFERTFAKGSLGFGEAYMDGWWDSEAIDQMLTRVFDAQLEQEIRSWRAVVLILKSRLFNQGRLSKAYEIGERHYDVGNDLYKAMLDKRMVYTCGYWKRADNLDEAQEHKLDLTCRKIGLESGMRVLDIGCGWGSFAKFAAEHYGAEVVGVTVSKKQVQLAKERCQGLPVEIRLQDYRLIDGVYDRVVSLGMFEHVGYKNYHTFMDVCDRALAPGGLFLLHTIGRNESTHSTDPWINKYIFPNSMLPSIEQIGRASGRHFVMEDWHNFGTDYDKTLLAWHKNIEAAWPHLDYDERFRRMWRFYLLSSAATFRARKNQLWQIVFSKSREEPYTSIR